MHFQTTAINVLELDFDGLPEAELVDYLTHEVLRQATPDEVKQSVTRARRDVEGIGRIRAEGRVCYVL